MTPSRNGSEVGTVTAPSPLPVGTRSRSSETLRPSFDVGVLCELNVDVVLRTDQAPEFGQVEQRVEAGAVTLGSSGAITAAALASLGLDVAVCGTVGDDDLGALVLTMLNDLGVDVGYVRRLPARRTGITVVLTRSDGDRALMTYPGTMADFTPGHVPPELLAQTRHVHVSSIFLQNGLAPELTGLLATRPAGVTCSLDPGWDPDEKWGAVTSVLPQLDWLLPNANECLAIAGVAAPPDTDLSVADGASLLARCGPSVVVKLGAAGALLIPAGGGAPVRVNGIERRPLDTTGAGDNFNAGFIAAALDGGHDNEGALALGCACGSISTGGLGGTGRLAGAGEAAALAEEILRFDDFTTTENGKQPAGRPDLEYR